MYHRVRVFCALAAKTTPIKRLLGRYETRDDFDLIWRAYREGWVQDPETQTALVRRLIRLGAGRVRCPPVVQIRAAEVLRKITADLARRALRAQRAGR